MNPTNESLMAAYGATGDERAFAILVKRCEGIVYSYALRALGCPDEAEDVAQDVFLRVHSARARYRPDRAFLSWLMTITVNLCRDRFRRSKSRPTSRAIPLDEIPEPSGPVDLCDPSAPLERGESVRAIERAIADLPLSYREAMILHYTQSLSIAQMAEILGISRGAVETRLYRARLHLRHALKNGREIR